MPRGVVGESIVGDLRESYEAAASRDGAARAGLRYCTDVLRIALSPPRDRLGSAALADRGAVGAGLASDMRQAVRSLVRTPAFTLAATAILGIGIGTTLVAFSVVDRVLLRPFSYADPTSLVSVMHRAPGIGVTEMGLSTGTFFTFLDRSRTLDGIAAWRSDLLGLSGPGDPVEVEAVGVTEGVLPLLGVRPALGRLFTAADASPGAPLVVLIADELWRSRFGADPAAIGRTLTVEGIQAEIAGVLPAGFRFMDVKPLLYFPLQLDRSRAGVGSYNYRGVGRLAEGETLEAARAELAALIPVAAADHPRGASVERVREMGLEPVVRPLAESIVGNVRTMLRLLLGAGILVLLVGAANVAGLILVRAEVRRREWAIRAALGAGRGRMARMSFLESGALAASGCAAGLLVAAVGIRMVRTFGPTDVPRLEDIGVDWRLVAVSVGAAWVVTLILGLVPLLRSDAARREGALAALGRTRGAGRLGRRARAALATLQLSLALTLLVGAGLMVRSLRAIGRVPAGFEAADDVLTFRVGVPEREAPDPDLALATHRRIAEAVGALAGVRSVAMASSVPMDGRRYGNSTAVEGRPDDVAASYRYKFVSEDYFSVLGISLVAGRAFEREDIEARRDVAIVSESFAREYWPDPASAIGRHIAQDPRAGWREIVGVVGDVRDDGPTEQVPAIVYWPLAVRDFWGIKDRVERSLVYAVRTSPDGASGLGPAVRRAVWSVAGRLPVASLRTQQAIVDARTARVSFVTGLLGVASGMALLMAVVGLYGAMAYLVSTRVREIGVRVALGAGRRGVVAMIVREGAGLALLGAAGGMALSYGLSRLMSGLVFGVALTDPVTYVVAAAALAVVALAATALPAARAAAVDPVRALQTD